MASKFVAIKRKTGKGKAVKDMENELLTLGEAARVLRVRLSTIRAWRLQRKHLTFRKIGGKVLVHRDDVTRLIEKSKAPACRV